MITTVDAIIIGIVLIIEAVFALLVLIIVGSRVHFRSHGTRHQSDLGPDALHDGPQPVSTALADWADARLAAAGVQGLYVSRKFPALRNGGAQVAFWGASPNGDIRIGLTFVTRDDVALVDEHAPTDLAEEGRRLASWRDDLVARGVNPTELLTPLHPEQENPS